MATCDSTIGAALDYVDLGAWEADMGTTCPTGAGTTGDDAIAHVANEIIVEGATLVINNTSPDSIKVTVDVADRHDGTPGTGARWVMGAIQRYFNIAVTITLEWYEVDANSLREGSGRVIAAGGNTTVTIQNCLLHARLGSTGNDPAKGIRITAAGTSANIFNNIIFDMRSVGSGVAYGAELTGGSGGGTSIKTLNNTITDIQAASSGDSIGIVYLDDVDHELKNNLVTDVAGGATSGTEACYSISAPSNIVPLTNLSDDASSPNSALRSKTVTFVNAASEDYHLASGDTDAIDAGTDLGTTANIDIDGRDRDAEADTWDVGADEFVAVGGAVPKGPLGHPFHGAFAGPVAA